MVKCLLETDSVVFTGNNDSGTYFISAAIIYSFFEVEYLNIFADCCCCVAAVTRDQRPLRWLSHWHIVCCCGLLLPPAAVFSISPAQRGRRVNKIICFVHNGWVYMEWQLFHYILYNPSCVSAPCSYYAHFQRLILVNFSLILVSVIASLACLSRLLLSTTANKKRNAPVYTLLTSNGSYSDTDNPNMTLWELNISNYFSLIMFGSSCLGNRIPAARIKSTGFILGEICCQVGIFGPKSQIISANSKRFVYGFCLFQILNWPTSLKHWYSLRGFLIYCLVYTTKSRNLN